jgi:hypothetical protein
MTRRACIIVAMLIAAPASADSSESVMARDMIPLRVRPAERAPSYANVDRGSELEVLAERGRWLRVRHGRRVGWVTRTQVQAPPAKPVARPERSGFSGKHPEDAVKVTVSIDKVRAFDDPRTKANEVLELVKGDVVTVIGRGHQGWLLVESTAGDVGWIPGSVVDDAGKFAGDPRRAPAERVAADKSGATPAAVPAATSEPIIVRTVGAGAPKERRVTGGLIATAGVDSFQLRDAEAMGRATGPLGAISAGARMRVAREMWIGLAGNAGVGGGDLTYYTATETSKPMATRNIAIDASAEVGWGHTWSVAARGGYHMASFAVDSDRTDPMLVGEQFRGPTVGLGGSVPIGARFAVVAAVDFMPAGEHQPDDPSVAAATAVRGGWARTMVTVKLPAHLVGALAYRAGMLDAELPEGKTRSDRSHAVSAGLGMTW